MAFNSVSSDFQVSYETLISPLELKTKVPISSIESKKILQFRQDIFNILNGLDPRLLVVVGPCSIHDPEAIIAYAEKLKRIIKPLKKELFVVVRTYFEKPRTRLGWKGLLIDPFLDTSNGSSEGLIAARSILKTLTQLDLPCACEFLNTITPHYLIDFVSWSALGARSVESQALRELYSLLPTAVGVKNPTYGELEGAIDALTVINHPHRFMSINNSGRAALYQSEGNPNTHLILRGSTQGSNYQKEAILKSIELLEKNTLPARIMIDCSHANSQRNTQNQVKVIEYLSNLISQGFPKINGVMIESNLIEGNQSITQKPLCIGQSITDPCLGIDETERLLKMLSQSVLSAK